MDAGDLLLKNPILFIHRLLSTLLTFNMMVVDILVLEVGDICYSAFDLVAEVGCHPLISNDFFENLFVVASLGLAHIHFFLFLCLFVI